MIKTYRAWLNDDPESNETVDFTLPEGNRVGETWNNRIWHYSDNKNFLEKQMCVEVMALKRICLANKLPKDIYNLLKNEYIKRPVRKLPRTPVQAESYSLIEMTLKIVLIFIMLTGSCTLFTTTAKSTVVPGIDFYADNAGIRGPVGPPGVCGIPALKEIPGIQGEPAVKGETLADYTIINGKGINVPFN